MGESRPRQQQLFATNEMPESHWGWVVDYRLRCMLGDDLSTWSEWGCAPRPNHFRSEAGAKARVAEMMEEYGQGFRLSLLEIRVVPKYLGYVPPPDEAWINP